jgi:hypothetical protein
LRHHGFGIRGGSIGEKHALFASSFASADFRPGRVRLAVDCKASDGQPYGAQILVADGSPIGTLSVNVFKSGSVGTIESFNVVNRYNQSTRQNSYVDTRTHGQNAELRIRNNGTQAIAVLHTNSLSGRLNVRMNCDYLALTM